MTTPAQRVHALNITREFLRDIATGKRMGPLVLRKLARDCLSHYPGEYHVKRRWADDVCEHGQDRGFYRDCRLQAQDESSRDCIVVNGELVNLRERLARRERELQESTEGK